MHRAEKAYCDERKSSKDRTPTRTRNLLIMKKDLQCDKCGVIQSICDGNSSSRSRCSQTAPHHFSDEHFQQSQDNFSGTNARRKSESSYSLSKSPSFSTTNDLHLTIRRRIVYTQVLLEAFGNASIASNSNSSRFVSIKSELVFNRILILLRILILIAIAGKLF